MQPAESASKDHLHVAVAEQAQRVPAACADDLPKGTACSRSGCRAARQVAGLTAPIKGTAVPPGLWAGGGGPRRHRRTQGACPRSCPPPCDTAAARGMRADAEAVGFSAHNGTMGPRAEGVAEEGRCPQTASYHIYVT
ncbi:hypothetical protein AAFF_G00307340 [Aldrovandia affinis]|uniref:Uncharacterized protein n=1 Tax=Aldrovandia affinis TaxID=143900 RepID=A0AAD7W199_9TELE|nr:hypothetical protein AAFF_G00307340 [Aldrovandia affinis]